MFWKKKNSNANEVPVNSPKDSVAAMYSEANRQGWLPDNELKFIPELVSIYKNAADYFFNLIAESESNEREALMYYVCRYLFAKGVEGVILWGHSSDGQISVYFHPKHLGCNIETEVPEHLHNTIIDSMSVGDQLFSAHQKFIIECQNRQVTLDLREEMQKTVQWIGRFGISYALFHNYQALR